MATALAFTVAIVAPLGIPASASSTGNGSVVSSAGYFAVPGSGRAQGVYAVTVLEREWKWGVFWKTSLALTFEARQGLEIPSDTDVNGRPYPPTQQALEREWSRTYLPRVDLWRDESAADRAELAEQALARPGTPATVTYPGRLAIGALSTARWWIVGLFAVVSLIMLVRLQAVERRAVSELDVCEKCGYDRKGIDPGKPCPECGG
ncbi:MAG: hypothetical protein QM783_04260 [Phycisphaerales bacterium]